MDSKAECDQLNLAHKTKANKCQCPHSSVQVKDPWWQSGRNHKTMEESDLWQMSFKSGVKGWGGWWCVIVIEVQACYCGLQLDGDIGDCACSIESVDFFNNEQVFPAIDAMMMRNYFRYYKVTRRCSSWSLTVVTHSLCAVSDTSRCVCVWFRWTCFDLVHSLSLARDNVALGAVPSITAMRYWLNLLNQCVIGFRCMRTD